MNCVVEVASQRGACQLWLCYAISRTDLIFIKRIVSGAREPFNRGLFCTNNKLGFTPGQATRGFCVQTAEHGHYTLNKLVDSNEIDSTTQPITQ